MITTTFKDKEQLLFECESQKKALYIHLLYDGKLSIKNAYSLFGISNISREVSCSRCSVYLQTVQVNVYSLPFTTVMSICLCSLFRYGMNVIRFRFQRLFQRNLMKWCCAVFKPVARLFIPCFAYFF